MTFQDVAADVAAPALTLESAWLAPAAARRPAGPWLVHAAALFVLLMVVARMVLVGAEPLVGLAIALSGGFLLVAPWAYTRVGGREELLARQLALLDAAPPDQSEACPLETAVSRSMPEVRMLEPWFAQLQWGGDETTDARLEGLGRARQRAAALFRPCVVLTLIVGWAAYAGSLRFFETSMALAPWPDPLTMTFTIAGAFVATVAGLSAGRATWRAISVIIIAREIARLSDSWQPFVESAGRNAEAVTEYVVFSTRHFVYADGLLLPGMIAVALRLDEVGVIALFAICLKILIIALTMLLVPAYAIHKKSALDKERLVRVLSQRLQPVAAAFVTAQAEGGTKPSREDYRLLQGLLELRNHVVAQPASPAVVPLLWRTPLAVTPSVLAVLPFIVPS
jgi:hypothetical protein